MLLLFGFKAKTTEFITNKNYILSFQNDLLFLCRCRHIVSILLVSLKHYTEVIYHSVQPVEDNAITTYSKSPTSPLLPSTPLGHEGI